MERVPEVRAVQTVWREKEGRLRAFFRPESLRETNYSYDKSSEYEPLSYFLAFSCTLLRFLQFLTIIII